MSTANPWRSSEHWALSRARVSLGVEPVDFRVPEGSSSDRRVSGFFHFVGATVEDGEGVAWMSWTETKNGAHGCG